MIRIGIADDANPGLALVQRNLIAVRIIITGHIEIALAYVDSKVGRFDRGLNRILRAPALFYPADLLGAAVGDEPAASASSGIRPQIAVVIERRGLAGLDDNVLIGKLSAGSAVDLRVAVLATIVEAVLRMVIKTRVIVCIAGKDNLRDKALVKVYLFLE